MPVLKTARPSRNADHDQLPTGNCRSHLGPVRALGSSKSSGRRRERKLSEID